MIREAVETLTRSWRFTRTLDVGERRVPLVVSPSAGLRYLFRPMARIDPVLVAQAERYVRPGAVVWDAGANVGLFAFAAAAIAGPGGHVVAFEPDRWLAKLLRRSAARQPASSARVEVLPHAIAGANGMRTLHIARRSRSANFLAEYADLVPFITNGAAETHTVMAITLDAALGFLPAPDLVKIDVEGAEVEALEGATRLLATVRPVVLCEVFGPHMAAVTALLRGHGYDLIDAETGARVDVAAWNTIALPGP